jgi:hypothetical protein
VGSGGTGAGGLGGRLGIGGAGTGGSPSGGRRGDADAQPMDAGAEAADARAETAEAVVRPLDGGGSIKLLSIRANDLVFDPKRGVLYATTNLAPGAGVVLSIDPVSMTVTAALPIGGIPGVLAISDDASALYVGINTTPITPTPGIDGGDSVRRIDLASMTVGPLVSLGSNTISGVVTAGQIVTVPGSPTRYVVSLRQPGVTPDFGGLALYDGNTMLSRLDPFFGSGDSITFADPSTLFGCSNDLSPSELVQYRVTTAITPAPGIKVSGLITDGQRTRITFNGGWIFVNDGQTLSAKTLAVVGTYDDSIIARYAQAAALPDPDGANVWFLRTADPSKAALLDFDRTTFQLRRSISLAPVLDDYLPEATALVQWSPNGFAFRTFSRVYVMTVPNFVAPDGGVDAGCDNLCTSVGTMECAANSRIATCADQSATCRRWQTSTTCGEGRACQRLGGPLCFDPNWAAWPMPNDATDVAQGAPNPTRYTDNGDGAVSDNVTGLMWQKTVPATLPPPSQIWNDAVATCRGLRLAGFDNWRLPSAIELLSIVDYEKAKPAIDQAVFPNTPTYPFWTSSTTPSAGATYWVVLFDDGRTIPQGAFTQMYSYARCVR